MHWYFVTKLSDCVKPSDIEMIGIGIETTAVNRLFNTNIVIEDAADLQKHCLS